MHEVTRILSAIEQGDPQAAGQLLPLVYDELRRPAVRGASARRIGIRKVGIRDSEYYASRSQGADS